MEKTNKIANDYIRTKNKKNLIDSLNKVSTDDKMCIIIKLVDTNQDISGISNLRPYIRTIQKIT